MPCCLMFSSVLSAHRCLAQASSLRFELQSLHAVYNLHAASCSLLNRTCCPALSASHFEVYWIHKTANCHWLLEACFVCMKSFFSRLNDIQASSSKPTKESSYKFWIPSNINTERTPPKPIPVHPDVAASHETRSRALKSTHALKIPLHDLPTAPIEAQAIHTTDMSRHTTKPNLGSSSMAYSQNYPPPSSRTPRIHEPNDRHPVPSRKAHGPADPIGTHTPRETSSKLYRGGRHESVAPVSREIWFPPAMPVSTKLHIQGTSEKLERYRESGDERDRVKELERREKDRDRREREGEKGRTREREKEEREREKNRAKERERGHGKDREITRAKRQLDRNWETDGGRERDKYAERDRREKERDSDREGDKVKNRTKDKGSRKESSNLTKGMERAWDSDVLYDEERTKQDERSKTRHRDRTTGGGGRDDNRDSHKERERWLEKEAERTRERLEGQIRHRVEATDGEQDARRVKTPAPDRERRKDLGVGWTSDTGHSRKLLRKTSNTLLNATSKAEEGESSDSSTRPKRVQVLTKRHRAEEGGSSSKVFQNCTLFCCPLTPQTDHSFSPRRACRAPRVYQVISRKSSDCDNFGRYAASCSPYASTHAYISTSQRTQCN